MRRIILWAALTAGCVAAAPVPVLLELFTSEGCSSCPPADALLAALLEEQPLEGIELIGLSEHVDYWNQLGWADPFSSAHFSERQQRYARQFAREGPYTPQLVVDGRRETVGSITRQVTAAITAAAREPKLPLELTAIRRDGAVARARVRFPQGAPEPAQLMAALAEAEATIAVRRGENAGRTLRHVAITRALAPVAKLKRDEPWEGEITLPIPAAAGRALRLVLFVQTRPGAVVAVASGPVE